LCAAPSIVHHKCVGGELAAVLDATPLPPPLVTIIFEYSPLSSYSEAVLSVMIGVTPPKRFVPFEDDCNGHLLEQPKLVVMPPHLWSKLMTNSSSSSSSSLSLSNTTTTLMVNPYHESVTQTRNEVPLALVHIRPRIVHQMDRLFHHIEIATNPNEWDAYAPDRESVSHPEWTREQIEKAVQSRLDEHNEEVKRFEEATLQCIKDSAKSMKVPIDTFEVPKRSMFTASRPPQEVSLKGRTRIRIGQMWGHLVTSQSDLEHILPHSIDRQLLCSIPSSEGIINKDVTFQRPVIEWTIEAVDGERNGLNGWHYLKFIIAWAKPQVDGINMLRDRLTLIIDTTQHNHHPLFADDALVWYASI
jgi:hypothetical protein